MPAIPLRPSGIPLFGVFETPAYADASSLVDYTYTHWDFNGWIKPQIDAARSIGANLWVYFGAVQPSIISMGLPAYLAMHKERLDYLHKVGMRALPYGCDTPTQWGGTSTANAATFIAGVAQLSSKYPNCPAMVLIDEAMLTTPPSGPTLTIIQTVYDAARAVVPTNFPLCGTANPCGNPASAAGNCFEYGAGHDSQTCCDNTAAYNNFFAFHPFVTASLAQSSALRTQYPNHKIVMPSSVLSANGAGDMQAKAESIMGLVGANNFEGMGWWNCLDHPAVSPATAGLFNNDLTPRAAKTDVFTANSTSGLRVIRQRRAFSSRRMNQALCWQRAA